MAAEKAIESELYYHGLLPREDIRKMLKRNGDFLVRTTEPKAGQPRCFVLSVMYDQKREEAGIKHYVVQTREGKYVIQRYAFETMPEMIAYHLKHQVSINKDLEVLIKRPINRQAWELSHDDIEITKKLGEGAFGEVSLGRLRTKKGVLDCAIKQAKLESMTKEQIKKITREARLMRMFDHPNVVKLYGVAAGREPLMIVMELADKGSLDSFLVKNGMKIAPEDRLQMILDAARALRYVHSCGILHCDIAARNCLYGKGELKLSDFGMSRKTDRYRMAEDDVTPVRWTAPEVFVERVMLPASDVWAMGVLAWEIFNNAREPYEGMAGQEVRDRVVKDQYRLPPLADWAPIEMNELLDEMFKWNQKERIATGELVNRMEKICAKYPLSKTPKKMGNKPAPPSSSSTNSSGNRRSSSWSKKSQVPGRQAKTAVATRKKPNEARRTGTSAVSAPNRNRRSKDPKKKRK